MTRTRLALAAGVLAVAAFAAGHLTAPGAPAPFVGAEPDALVIPRGKSPVAHAPEPDAARPAPDGIDLGSPSDCGAGGTCLSEKYLLLPLRG